MTYHEDVAAVKDSFKRMLENGVIPISTRTKWVLARK